MASSELNEVGRHLNQLLAEIEQKYTYIYETLPKSERDVNLGIDEVEILLKFFSSLIKQALQDIAIQFDGMINSLVNQELIDLILENFLDTSDDARHRFSKLIHLSEDMEIALAALNDLAINSIIFSSKVGEQGAAFQVLSNRINLVSTSLDLKFRKMNQIIINLGDWNKQFKTAAGEYVRSQEQIKVDLSSKFKQEFASLENTLTAVNTLQRDNLTKTKLVFGEVANIMVMIQYHDIIRQSLENLVRCVEIANGKTGDQVFVKKTLELSVLLLGKIEESLHQSLLLLEQIVGGMFNEVSELEGEATALAKYLVGETPDSTENMMHDVFSVIMADFQRLIQFNEHMEQRSKEIIQQKDEFFSMMSQIEKDFIEIHTDVRSLKQMKVLIKIELARIDWNHVFNEEEIIKAVEDVIETVGNSHKAFLQLKEHFFSSMLSFTEIIEQSVLKVTESTEEIDRSGAKLNTAYSLSSGVVRSSREEMQEIFSRLKDPNQHLADTAKISTLLRDSSRMLQKELAKMQTGIDGELGAEDLVLLKDQLTCQSERDAFRQLFGEIDQDAEGQGGEIELF